MGGKLKQGSYVAFLRQSFFLPQETSTLFLSPSSDYVMTTYRVESILPSLKSTDLNVNYILKYICIYTFMVIPRLLLDQTR
jgi:hypothetical protein